MNVQVSEDSDIEHPGKRRLRHRILNRKDEETEFEKPELLD